MVRWIVISGIDEVGRNCHLLETDDELYIVDCGVRFGTLKEPGIEYIIPDFSYIVENADKLKGAFFSHAHEDHIGAVPYLLEALKGKLNRLDIYSAPLTLEMLKDYVGGHHGIAVNMRAIHPREEIRISHNLSVLPIHVNHSIPHALSLAFYTKEGKIIYTGDFKIDQNHPTMETTDLHTFARLGEEGVKLLLSDSTNADEPGFGTSEMKVREGLEKVFATYTDRRIIISVFASHVSRIELIMSLAKKYGRVVAVDGRGIVKITQLSRKLGFLADYDDIIVSVSDALALPPESQVILSTGTQGEPLSALTRMAYDKHRFIKLQPEDVVVISADPIPGNERAIFDVINRLFKKGVEVVYSEYFLVHASGHASMEELRLMLNLVRPEYFVPIHGERRQLVSHKKLAIETRAVKEDNVYLLERGDAIRFEDGKATIEKEVASAREILVDGGVVDISTQVVSQRMELAKDGIIIAIFTLDRRNKAKLQDLVVKGAYVGDEKELQSLKQYISSAAGEIVSRPDLTIKQKEDMMKEKIASKLASKWRQKPHIEVRVIPVH
ncbi:MAG: ribonuclease J [Dictyoglomi bacterium]|nr:ribonuclease J [Dictyoglomota bacterium]